jgi:hypothetical protein
MTGSWPWRYSTNQILMSFKFLQTNQISGNGQHCACTFAARDEVSCPLPIL